MLVRQPLFALFWVGLATASQNCLSSNIAGTKGYDACCTGQSSGTESINGVEFQYTCQQYSLDSNRKQGQASVAMTAADCAGQCAENPECVVSTWYATKKQCLALSDRGFRTYGPAKYWVTFVRTGKTTEEKGGNEQCSSEKLVLEKDLQERCEKEKVTLSTKCDEDRTSIDKKLQESKEEWEKKITALKTTCDADKSAKEQCEQDKAELNKKHNEEKNTKEKLEQEKQDILNKYKEEKAALEKANNDAKTKLEQENNKLKEVIATSGGGPAKPDSLPVGINPYLPCPNIDGKEYTVDGVTYRAFCWKKPRGRYINTDVDGGKLNIRDLVIGMKACSLDSACQGVYSDHQSYWTIHLDYQFPPLEEIPRLNSEQHLSFIPVQPRGNNFKPNALAIPSLLAGNVFGGCPESDGQQLTIGSHTFNFHCREYTGAPDAQLPISSYIRYPPWCLAVCAGTPGCEGTSMGYGSCKFYSRFEKLEKMEQSKIVPHHWVAVLSQAGND